MTANFGIDSNLVFDVNGKSVAARLSDHDTSLTSKANQIDLDVTNKRTKGITDPRELGAVGDGVNDDTLAIQTWLNDGKLNKVLRDGTFRITSGLTSSIVGRSIKTNGAKIIVDSLTDIIALTVTGDKSKISVDIDGQNKAAIGIYVTASGCEVKKCRIENLLGVTIHAVGVKAETSGGVRIEENTILNISANSNNTIGDMLGAARAVLVTSTTAASALNTVRNNTIAGITGEEGDAIQFLFFDGTNYPFLDAQGVIQGNTIKNCNRRAVKVQASNVKVLNNTHINTLVLSDLPTANSLINVIQSNDVVVMGNTLDATYFTGISLSGVSTNMIKRCTVKGNTIRGGSTAGSGLRNDTNGIYLEYTQDSEINSNTIYDGLQGIAAVACQDTSISDNTLYGGSNASTQYAINITSTNARLVIKGNRQPSGARLYMVNQNAPDCLVQGNYINAGGGCIRAYATSVGSYYVDNTNAYSTAVIIGDTTGQIVTNNINM